MDVWIVDILFTQSQYNSHIIIITFNNIILHSTYQYGVEIVCFTKSHNIKSNYIE